MAYTVCMAKVYKSSYVKWSSLGSVSKGFVILLPLKFFMIIHQISSDRPLKHLRLNFSCNFISFLKLGIWIKNSYSTFSYLGYTTGGMSIHIWEAAVSHGFFLSVYPIAILFRLFSICLFLFSLCLCPLNVLM